MRAPLGLAADHQVGTELLPCADVALACADVVLACADVALPGADVALACADIALPGTVSDASGEAEAEGADELDGALLRPPAVPPSGAAASQPPPAALGT